MFDTDKARGIGSGGHLFGVLLETLAEKKAGSKVTANTVALVVAFALTSYDLDIPVDVLRGHFSSSLLGIRRHGFALIDVLQCCGSFNWKNTFAWCREGFCKLEGADYHSSDKLAAFERAQEWCDKILIRVVYREEKPACEVHLVALRRGPLAQRKVDPVQAEKLLDGFL